MAEPKSYTIKQIKLKKQAVEMPEALSHVVSNGRGIPCQGIGFKPMQRSAYAADRRNEAVDAGSRRTHTFRRGPSMAMSQSPDEQNKKPEEGKHDAEGDL